MKITIKKPSEQEQAEMQKLPTWGCGVSKFDWYYDQEETCLLLEGEVEVICSGESTYCAAGDMVTFPKGMACVWNVTKPIKKHYMFN